MQECPHFRPVLTANFARPFSSNPLVRVKLTEAAISAVKAYGELCEELSSRKAELIERNLKKFMGIEVSDLSERIEEFLQGLDRGSQDNVIANLCDALVPESAAPSEDPHSVLCLTMHGAKGLTRKTVVIPGLEDSWLPGVVSGDDMGEKRRLFYVALTRATDRVLITFPRWCHPKDPLAYKRCGKPSRFIGEAGIPVRV